jgi:hypothetical protein
LELKGERVRLRGEWLTFKKDRFESWKRLMEKKGKEKEDILKLKIQLKRESFEMRRVGRSCRNNNVGTKMNPKELERE